MPSQGVEVKIEFPQMQEIQRAFAALKGNIAAKYMASALGKTADPAMKALRKTTPKGPTGNLRRAIRKKTKRYVKDGAGIAMVGYTAAPKKAANDLASSQKGHHQGFLEFGTKQRFTKGPIASRFKALGGPIKKVGKRKISTSPKPPKGFLKRVPDGERVDLGKFPIGGKKGVPPIKTAYQQTLGAMRSVLPREMTKSLTNALKEMARPFPTKN
jgi:hypothetical protein